MGRQNKLVVTYDEGARKEYLTGFRKRKTERRKVAQDKIKELEKKARKEARDEKRQKEKEMLEFQSTLDRFEAAAPPPDGASAKRKRQEEDDEAEAQQRREYNDDEFSKRAFGADAVVVSTTIGLDGEDDAEEDAGAQRELDALRELARGAAKPKNPVAGPRLRKAHKSVNTKAAAKFNKKKHGAKGSKEGKRKGGGGKKAPGA